MAQMTNQLRNQDEQIPNKVDMGSGSGYRSNIHFNPKVEFPTFNGAVRRGGLRNAPGTFLFVRFKMNRRWIWQVSILRGQLRSGLVVI